MLEGYNLNRELEQVGLNQDPKQSDTILLASNCGEGEVPWSLPIEPLQHRNNSPKRPLHMPVSTRPKFIDNCIHSITPGT
jgi:hypothetical protein